MTCVPYWRVVRVVGGMDGVGHVVVDGVEGKDRGEIGVRLRRDAGRRPLGGKCGGGGSPWRRALAFAKNNGRGRAKKHEIKDEGPHANALHLAFAHAIDYVGK